MLPYAIGLATLLLGCLLGAAVVGLLDRRYRREAYIREYVFPRQVFMAYRASYPMLGERECFLAAKALRSFFIAHLKANGQGLAMPSKAVDALWHGFILDTKAYAAFCQAAFGRFFHHLPAGNMPANWREDEALKTVWRQACLEDNINPNRPTRLPLLFALDAKLGFPNGNTYPLPPNGVTGTPKREGSSGCGGGSGSDAGGDGGCGGGCGGQ